MILCYLPVDLHWTPVRPHCNYVFHSQIPQDYNILKTLLTFLPQCDPACSPVH